MSSILEYLKSFGLSRVAAIIGVTAGVAIALMMIMVRIGEPQFSVLYADLDYSNAQSVISRLEQDGIPFKMRETGTRVAILVPRNDISTLRISLASSGFTTSSDIGYEIFDGQQPLGTTSFQQNINRLRALEGELARTVSSITGVRSARVHLVLPERSLFARDQRATTASIMVEANRRLEPNSVRAIINLVASAVPELSPDHITVLDANGNLLASARGDNDDNLAEDAMADRMLAAESRLQQTVNDLVASIVGVDNVRTRLTADFDFSRFTETAEIVDPDSQVVLSSTVIEEASDDQNPARARGVSVGNGLPGTETADANGQSATSSNRRTEEITNYEITKTVRNAVRDEGLIVNKLSVAVAINAVGADGTSIDRSPEELQRIEALVKSAIGFDETRGDQVEIANIAFSPLAAVSQIATPPLATPTPSLFSNQSVMRVIEITALLLIACSLILFVLRPLFSGKTSTQTTTNLPTLAETPVQSATITSENLVPLSDQASQPDALASSAPSSLIEQRINIAQIDGQVKASSVRQIQEIVKGHTDESALVLKRWIREAI